MQRRQNGKIRSRPIMWIRATVGPCQCFAKKTGRADYWVGPCRILRVSLHCVQSAGTWHRAEKFALHLAVEHAWSTHSARVLLRCLRFGAPRTTSSSPAGSFVPLRGSLGDSSSAGRLPKHLLRMPKDLTSGAFYSHSPALGLLTMGHFLHTRLRPYQVWVRGAC